MGRIRGGSAVARVITALGMALMVPAAAATQAVQDQPKKIDIEARLMFWGDAAERQGVPDQQEALNDFFVRRARIVLQGRASESITFSFQFGQDNIGAKVAADDGAIRVKDAYINYRGADAFQVTVGQFKIPFLRANLESGFNQVLVDRGTLLTLRPAREGSRDLGAMAWGNVKSLQYRLAVFDGSDQEARSPASSFRVSTRVAYNWFTRETGLGYTGSYLGRARVLQVAGQADVQRARLDARDEAAFALRPRDYRAYAVEVFFDQPFPRASAVTVEGAWFDRRDDYLDVTLPTRRLDGYSAQAALLVPGQVGRGRLQVSVRRERWHDERGGSEGRTSRTTGGATYLVGGHNRKVQADYTRKREPREIDNDEFRLSMVLVF